MKTMTVKELKAILVNANDEQNVVIDDVNDMCIAIVGGGESSADGIRLHTQQEFPAEWFDGDGEEIDWGYHFIKRLTKPEKDEMYINYADLTDGREVYVECTFYDGYAEGPGIRLKYPKVGDLTPEQIAKIDECLGGRIKDSGVITPNDVCLYCGKVTSFGIMDTTNSHSEKLVRQINVRWVEDREMFRPILLALYERDIDEITDADSFQLAKWRNTDEYRLGLKSDDWEPYMKMALADMKERWEDFAENYLMRIADDQDLEAIIMFVRYDRSENA